MVVTDKFVYVHQPKTGGTFVESILKRVHKSMNYQLTEKINNFKLTGSLSGIKMVRNGPGKNQHGRVIDIPKKYSKLKILATVRNPFDRYVSQYKFNFWKNGFPKIIRNKELMEHFPKFPDISFKNYIYLVNDILPKYQKRIDIFGYQTYQFFRQYTNIDVNKIDQRQIIKNINQYFNNIYFISTANLNEGLYNFLLDFNYPEDKIGFILHEKKIYPPEGGRKEDDNWEKYYDDELYQYVVKKENILLSFLYGKKIL